jgi:RNA polymerase sigma-70 factor, ECF subfamily
MKAIGGTGVAAAACRAEDTPEAAAALKVEVALKDALAQKVAEHAARLHPPSPRSTEPPRPAETRPPPVEAPEFDVELTCHLAAGLIADKLRALDPLPQTFPLADGVDPRYPDDRSHKSLGELVDRIRTGEPDGLAELYALFSKGIRFYLYRQLGPQELNDKIHDTFVLVVQAIRRGELREPQRLMGFVRTIVRRQVATHIDRVVHTRREQMDLESTTRIADLRENPEETAMFRQQNELIKRVLAELSKRDREILTRFYLHEQSQDQICSEMALTDTQFRLLKSRAKTRFGELGKKRLASRAFGVFLMRTSSGANH